MVFGLEIAFDGMGRYVAMHLSMTTAIIDQERGSSATRSICQKAPEVQILLKPRHELVILVISIPSSGNSAAHLFDQ